MSHFEKKEKWDSQKWAPTFQKEWPYLICFWPLDVPFWIPPFQIWTQMHISFEMIMWGGQLFCRNYPAMVITNTRDEREISLAPVQKKRHPLLPNTTKTGNYLHCQPQNYVMHILHSENWPLNLRNCCNMMCPKTLFWVRISQQGSIHKLRWLDFKDFWPPPPFVYKFTTYAYVVSLTFG